MKFPYTYFEDEVREGFYISGIIKRAWAAQLEVLAEVDKICKKHNIKWFADCGTLLGAVRHGGYIPWDDDLDICMLREDYIRFNEVAEQELPEEYVVLNLHKEEHYFEYLTRVTNRHGLCFDDAYLDKYHEFPYAVGIDIFPLDYIADDEAEEEQRKTLTSLVAMAADELSDGDENVADYKDVLNKIEEFCEIKLDYTKSIKQQLYQQTEELFTMYNDRKGKYVALMPYWITYNNHKYPAEYFDKTIMMPFETTELPVPAAYDGVLRIEYGDYMKIVKSGGVHGYPFFAGQEEHLKKLIPQYPFEYKFSLEDTENHGRAEYKRPKKQVENFVMLMAQAHMAIIQTIEQAQYEQAEQLLMSCQNGAIQIGTMLEEYYGQGFITVNILEEYCELIYQIYELTIQVNQMEGAYIDIGDIADCLNVMLEKIAASVNNDIHERREVVFMPVKASAWDSMDSVWRAAKEDSSCDVYVMPIPYYERKATGGKGEMHYEGESFPDYLEIIDYNTYDLEKRHPDIIFIQNAYDQCNYTTCIPDDYLSGNIKQYTDKLVYIPWFKLDEIEEHNEKARKTMEYFCTVPGIVHADTVIVQSEGMRREYIECMTKFAGEDTREIWENKILGLGTPLDDAEQMKFSSVDKREQIAKLPEEWQKLITKENGELKKIILYNTTVAAFMQHGEDMLSKIERTLDIFKSNRAEVALIWRPHPLTVSSLEASKPELVDRYNAIVGEYCQARWGIYDDTPDMETAINVCDAYYGDADGVAHRCETLGKPVMIQDVGM